MNNNYINKTRDFTMIFGYLREIIIGLIVFFVGILMLVRGTNTITRISAIPLLICGFAVFIRGSISLIRTLNMIKINKSIEHGSNLNINDIDKTYETLNKTSELSRNLYVIGFFIFWFGFLLYFDYLAIKEWSNGGSSLFFFSLIFWIVGFFTLKREL